MKAISVFNNKGGVGKTTLLCNLAAFLAMQREKRVLIIDADPQCNATQSVFRDSTIDDIYTNDRFTIYQVVQPLAAGKGYSKRLTTRKSTTFGVDVIPGDPRLALTEDLLATDWSQATAGSTRGLRTTFLFTNLLQRCAGYDFVLFDVGPSLGSINRSVLLASDFFVSPMSIDIFSLKAIQNTAISFKKWRQQLDGGLSLNEEPAELEVQDVRWKLRFAGYVTQQYTAKTDATGQKRAVKAFDEIMQQIPHVIDANFLPLEENPLPKDRYELGSIPTLHSLIPMSQTGRKPIFDLKSADGVVGAHFSRVRDYSKTIGGIADRLLDNLGRLS